MVRNNCDKDERVSAFLFVRGGEGLGEMAGEGLTLEGPGLWRLGVVGLDW